MINRHFVYILASKRLGALYIGSTDNLAQCVHDHKCHLIPGITSCYNINLLVYFESHSDFETASAREQGLKSLLRNEKIKLIDAFNPDWYDLFPDILRAISANTGTIAVNGETSAEPVADEVCS